MQFIDVEDLQNIQTANAPKTQAQIDRETYEEALEKDRLEQLVTDDHRKKTINCLLKVIDFQVKDIEKQANHIQENFKKNDEEIKEFEKFLKSEENRIVMQEIERKINKAREQVEHYEQYDPDKDDGKELVHVADLIVENKLFLDRIDDAMGLKGGSQATTEDDEDEESKLSQSFIDKMYKLASKSAKDKSKLKPASINVQFGKPIVDTHFKENRKSKSRTRAQQYQNNQPYKQSQSSLNYLKIIHFDEFI